MTFLEKEYKEKVSSSLQKKLGLKNKMQVPRLRKVILSVSTSEALKNPKILDSIQDELTVIGGQKAVITKAKKAIANFKLRKGVPLGVRVVLRKEAMWVFMEKFIHFAIPSVRDFRGFPAKGFDGRGNYNLGLKEQIVFPEVDYDKVNKVHGMNITICTSAQTDDGGYALLEALQFPLKKR